MPEGLTESERFVVGISNRAFLNLWTHPNPIGKKGKELCDCLIVCGNYIVIISVKEINYKVTGDIAGWKRWTRSAIEKSASQIWGAERWLCAADSFTTSDGREVVLPEMNKRIVHRLSVSLGANRKIPTSSGELGHGMVHVCDEYSLGVVFGLLDTITDFVEFLSEVEKQILCTNIIFDGGGLEDLLAVYLLDGNSFPFENADMICIDDTIFKSFVGSEDFKALQTYYKDSYFLDGFIRHLVGDLLSDGMIDFSTDDVTDNQLALVEMVLQPRNYRTAISRTFIELLESEKPDIAARVVVGYNKTVFVFLLGSSSNRVRRAQELAMRCLVVSSKLQSSNTVVGISRDKPGSSNVGYSSDLVYTNIANWTDDLKDQVTQIQSEYSYFENADWEQMNAAL